MRFIREGGRRGGKSCEERKRENLGESVHCIEEVIVSGSSVSRNCIVLPMMGQRRL